MAKTRLRTQLTLALCSGYFLVLMDVTVVNVALPQIGRDLGAGPSGLAWVVDAYSIPLAALLLIAGATGDAIGHRRVVLVGMAIFATASALCALAPQLSILVVARALQGTGAALLLPGTLALLTADSADEAARGRLVGIWAAVGGAALPAGPLVGGLLSQAFGWRAVFWLSVPMIAAALIPVARLRESVSPSVRGEMAPAKGWGRPLIVGFRTAGHRLWLASLVAAMMNMCALGGLFLLTQVFQNVHHMTPLASGLLTLPAMLPLPLLGIPAGRLVGRIGAWRASALGAAVAAVSMAGMAATLARPDHLALGVCLLAWGTGLGILTPSVVAAPLGSSPAATGFASGASNTARQAGGAVGIAVFAAAGPAHSAAFTPRAEAMFLAAAIVLATAAALSLMGADRPGRATP